MNHPQTRTAAPSGRQAQVTRGARRGAPATLSFRSLPALLLLGLILTACGNRGSLYLPDDEPLAAGNPVSPRQVTTASPQEAETAVSSEDGDTPDRDGDPAAEDPATNDEAKPRDPGGGEATTGKPS